MLGGDAAPSGSPNLRRERHTDDSRAKRGAASPLMWVVSETTLPFFRLALTESALQFIFAPLRLGVRFYPRSARKSAAAC